MIRVCVESPFRGDVALNIRYADACMLDCLSRCESPFLGHLQYPRVLDDDNPEHRAWGIEAHCAWLRAAERVAVYVDLGVTDGMIKAITLAESLTPPIPYEYRRLGESWQSRAHAMTRRTLGF